MARKMSGQKGNLEKRQKRTRTLSPRNEDSLGEMHEPNNNAQNYYVETVKPMGRTIPNGLSRMVTDQVKRKTRGRDVFGAGDRLD